MINDNGKVKSFCILHFAVVCGAILLTLFSLSAQVHAFEFNPNNIISDFELKNKNSMSLAAIGAFLEKYQSPLKDLTFDVNGAQKTSAEIIYEAAQAHIISPKFILTKLDHEQCLIRGCEFLKDPVKFQRALDWAAGFGVCTGCNINDPAIQKFKGFPNQVDALASVQNDYIRKATDKPYIIAKGQKFVTHDGYTVTPENQATANLYTYTPYRGGQSGIGGNYFFAKLWDQYWGHQFYPDGTVLKDSDGAYWLIDGGAKRRYVSSGVYLSSRMPEEAITASSAVLEDYAEGPPIKFANYSLVRDEAANIYLLVDGFKRKIEDQETMRILGFNPEEIEDALLSELAQFKNAIPITKTDVYPQGALLKDLDAGKLYWAQNGFKYEVYPEVARINYSRVNAISVSGSEIARYYPGEPKKITNGKFVRSGEGNIYMVSAGQLRLVPSMADFISLFGEDKSALIYDVTEKTLALHEVGAPLETNTYDRASDTSAPPSDTASPQVPSNPVVYKALFMFGDVPSTAVAKKLYMVSVAFKNKSNGLWNKEVMRLKHEESGITVWNTDTVLVEGVYSFKIPLSFDRGAIVATLKLYTKEGAYIPGGLYQVNIKVIEPEYQAVIEKHTIPRAVKNIWTRVAVEVHVKNTGKKAWTRRKTGLQFLSAGDGGESPFYDSADWVNKTVAAVALLPNQTEIKPGETAIFRFTLKPKGIRPGPYHYRIKLWMSDKEEAIYIQGGEYMDGVMRVDG